ncbi:hypothetical protein STEG23_009736 [Scotinomys teguina]
MCRLSWFLDPGGWSKAAAVGLYFIFPGICTLSLDNGNTHLPEVIRPWISRCLQQKERTYWYQSIQASLFSRFDWTFGLDLVFGYGSLHLLPSITGERLYDDRVFTDMTTGKLFSFMKFRLLIFDLSACAIDVLFRKFPPVPDDRYEFMYILLHANIQL